MTRDEFYIMDNNCDSCMYGYCNEIYDLICEKGKLELDKLNIHEWEEKHEQFSSSRSSK